MLKSLSGFGRMLRGCPAGLGMTKGIWHHTGAGRCGPKHSCFPRHAAAWCIFLVLRWLPRTLASTTARSPLLKPKKPPLTAWAVTLWLGNHVSYFKGNLEITVWTAWHLKRSIRHVDTYKQKMRPYCIMSSSFLACFKRSNLYNVKTYLGLNGSFFSSCFFSPDSRHSFFFFLHQKELYLKQLQNFQDLCTKI